MLGINLFGRSLARASVATGTATALTLGLAACGGDGADGGTAGEFRFRGPINIVVPFSPGGSADQTARQLAAEAKDSCGTNVVVRNQTGSAGAVGFQAVADAKPDGQTIGVAAIELAILKHLGVSEISNESVRGIMQYSLQPVAYAVPPDSPFQSINDVITNAKSGTVTVATSGTGSIYHIGFAGMAVEAGVADNMRNVPFDGAATALQAVLGKQTDMVSVGAAEMAPFVKDGKLRALAVAGDEKAPILPDTPTLKEEGIEWTSGAILGLIAPKETPDDAVQALNDCFNEARESEAMKNFMDTQGFIQEYKPAAEFDTYLAEQFTTYGEVVQATGLGSSS